MTNLPKASLLRICAALLLLAQAPQTANAYHWFNDAGTGTAAGTFVFARWQTLPVRYMLDNEALPSGVTFAGDIQPGLNAWQNVPTSRIAFQQVANTTGVTDFTLDKCACDALRADAGWPAATSPTWGIIGDGRNEIGYLHNSDLGSGLYGIGIATIDTTTGEITDMHMLINVDASAGTDPTFQGVVTHEVGHILGIGHSAVGSPDFPVFLLPQAQRPTMYAWANTGDGNRLESLELDDILVVSRIYPETVDSPPGQVPFSLTQQISGRVVKGTDGSSARGVEVRLVNTANNNQQVGVISDFFGTGTGEWAVPGLPAGSWYALIDEMTGTVTPQKIEDDGDVGGVTTTYTGFPDEHFDSNESNHDTASDKVALPVWSNWNTGNVVIVTNQGSRPDPSITPWGAAQAPPTPPWWQTPDIWVDNDGEGVKNETGEPSRGKADNKLKALVTNKGNANASGYQVAFSFKPYTTSAAAPAHPIASATESGTLAPGASREYTVDWNLTSAYIQANFPAAFWSADHFCVVAEIQPTGATLSDSNPHNNKAQNNFANVPMTSGTGGLSRAGFWVYNHLDREADASLEWRARDEGFRLRFEGVADPARIRLQPRQWLEVTAVAEPTGEAGRGKPGRPVLIDVTQRLAGEVVGGLTLALEQPVTHGRGKLHAGIFSGGNWPLGSMADDYDPAFLFGAQLERDWTYRVRAGLQLGFHQFDAENPLALDNLSVTNLSLYGRFRDPAAVYPPFAILGIGAYHFDGSWDPGAMAGVGFEVPISSSVSLMSGATLHLVRGGDDRPDLDWIDAYLGFTFSLP